MSISPHAEPFYADATPTGPDGQRVGVLLSHGFTGSPASMVPWGRHLAGHGYGVAVPRLPGHGTSWQELNKCRWADWYGEVQRAFDKLAANCDQVVVGGLSMGGGLVLQLAAERGRDVAGIVLNSPRQCAGDVSIASNADELACRCAAPLLAVVAHDGGFDREVDWVGLGRRAM